MARKASSGKYKLKTHKATSKRFKMTGSGKVVRTKIGKGHLRRHTSQRTKYLLAETLEVTSSGLVKHIKRLAPYMSKRD